MSKHYYTSFNNFRFIVKTPNEAKCRILSKSIILTHEQQRDYSEFIEEYNNSLFCSSTDENFEEVLKLYNSPVSFDCIAIDSIDVNAYDLKWLAEEMLDEFSKRFPDDIFYDLYFI